MRVATLSINNINKRLDNLLGWLAKAEPDVVNLQELKAEQAAFPVRALRSLGHEAVWLGEHSWKGVATLTGVTFSTSGAHTITTNYVGVSGSVLARSNTGEVYVRAVPTVALASSARPELLSNSVAFTATVSSGSGTRTGTVDFYEGTTLLGSCPRCPASSYTRFPDRVMPDIAGESDNSPGYPCDAV